MTGVEPFDNFLQDGSNSVAKWTSWVEQLGFFLTTKDLDEVATTETTFATRDKKRCAFLSHLMGPKTYSLYRTSKTDDDTFVSIVEKVTKALQPTKNIFFERNNFEKICQHEDEPFSAFLDRLREAAAPCEFEDLDNRLLQSIATKTHCNDFKRQLVYVKDLTLSTAIEMAKRAEMINQQFNAKHVVNKVGVGNHNRPRADATQIVQFREPAQPHPQSSQPRSYQPPTQFSERRQREQRSTSFSDSCNKCGRSHGYRQCPAYGKQCNKCEAYNHFASQCRSRPRHQANAVASNDVSDEEYAEFALAVHPKGDIKKVQIVVEDQPI